MKNCTDQPSLIGWFIYHQSDSDLVFVKFDLRVTVVYEPVNNSKISLTNNVHYANVYSVYFALWWLLFNICFK